MTAQMDVILPSVVVAEMLAVPAPTAVTTPLLTVATVASLEDQFTTWEAPEGMTVADRVAVSPFSMLSELELRTTPVAFTSEDPETVTLHVSVFLPSSVVTVIVASPTDTAVTFPLETVATEALLVDQVTFLLVASEGETVATRVLVPPTSRFRLVLSKDTPVTLLSLSPFPDVSNTAAAISAIIAMAATMRTIILFFSILITHLTVRVRRIFQPFRIKISYTSSADLIN